MLHRPFVVSLALLTLFLVGCSSQAEAPKARAESRPSVGGLHDGFDRILRRHVRGERVDYQALHAEERAALQGYQQRLIKTDITTLSKAEQLAFYINLYNATMIDAVLQRQQPGYSPADKDFVVFKDPLVILPGGKKVSLNHLENEIIRKQFDEPRIHAALVCGAVSCPPLLPRAYRGKDLNQVLEQNMRRFINDPSRNQILPKEKKVRLSKIFDWYAADFGGKAKLLSYLTRYIDVDVAGFAVEYVDYDWALNRVR